MKSIKRRRSNISAKFKKKKSELALGRMYARLEEGSSASASSAKDQWGVYGIDESKEAGPLPLFITCSCYLFHTFRRKLDFGSHNQ